VLQLAETRVVGTAFDDAVTWAAWLYYSDEMTQSDIAELLGVSRATIVNYLQEARDRGIVSIQLDTAIVSRASVAHELADKYGLSAALVIPNRPGEDLNTRLGSAGARVLVDQLRAGDVVGVAWGRTVLALAESAQLRTPIKDLTVVQVSGHSISAPTFSPELCTSILSSRLKARCVNLLAPALLSTAKLKQMLLDEPVLRQQASLIESCSKVVFGVGDLLPNSTLRLSSIASEQDVADYASRGAVAAIIGRFIDENGQWVHGPLDDRMVGLELDELKRINYRLCVAGGADKVSCIRATLLGGYASVLVTDTATATALMADKS
jgi:DNA-binding transcriptional regulator LsrR (DeoR family)